MSQNELLSHDAAAALPATAPVVRLTAGAGSAGQKTWNVRRPVTLIGSRRPAHITLHDRDIADAHCVILNTGADVLLKDLHTTIGTFRNNQRVNGCAVLEDGDIVTDGATKLQIAIQPSEHGADDPAGRLACADPTRYRTPVNVRLDGAETRWKIEDAVVLIGRHENAAIRLDHEAISIRHAILCRFLEAPAIFDLGGRAGVSTRGERCTFSPLRNADRVKVGPYSLTITSSAESVASQSMWHGSDAYNRSGKTPNPISRANVNAEPSPAHRNVASCSHADSTRRRGVTSAPDRRSPAEALADIESELGTLQRNITDSWERLNAWQSRLLEDATRLTNKESNLVNREAALDAKDAALRGQLHDLTRYHEQITARERELSEQLARIQARQEGIETTEAALAEKETGLTRRGEDLKRREHVLAQRWTRLAAATCSHCGRPVNIRTTGSPQPPA